MSSAIKSVSDPKLKLEVLSVEDIHRIHEATLTVIEKTGVRFPSSRALDIWEEHGATVDRERHGGALESAKS